jgi:glucose-1-phosphate cytidylyltransferase
MEGEAMKQDENLKEQHCKVVILCGGFGTRLKEQTEFIPKPMVRVGENPIIWHIMKIYDHYGFREFVLPLGYKGDMIKDYFVHYNWQHADFTLEIKKGVPHVHNHDKCEDWTIHFVDTGIATHTALRVEQVRHLLDKDQRFMLTYGDGVGDIDIARLLAFHKEKVEQGAVATITGFTPTHRFGIVDHEDGFVKSFKEKPKMIDRVNCGFMVFEHTAFAYFKGEDIMMEKLLPQIAADGKLALYEHSGEWYPMDTQREYEELNKLWSEGPPWKVWDE